MTEAEEIKICMTCPLRQCIPMSAACPIKQAKAAEARGRAARQRAGLTTPRKPAEPKEPKERKLRPLDAYQADQPVWKRVRARKAWGAVRGY